MWSNPVAGDGRFFLPNIRGNPRTRAKRSEEGGGDWGDGVVVARDSELSWLYCMFIIPKDSGLSRQEGEEERNTGRSRSLSLILLTEKLGRKKSK